ncbi:hypothetical protein NL676_028370 [Syzygium grande]|nr:hypothetical protein NL676_028370 [Syzygium grande]
MEYEGVSSGKIDGTLVALERAQGFLQATLDLCLTREVAEAEDGRVGTGGAVQAKARVSTAGVGIALTANASERVVYLESTEFR